MLARFAHAHLETPARYRVIGGRIQVSALTNVLYLDATASFVAVQRFDYTLSVTMPTLKMYLPSWTQVEMFRAAMSRSPMPTTVSP